jgi:serine phosphatase RsbU (regulator of sigma subunit)
MTLKQFWHNVTFLGLKDDQEFSHREVILLNKLVFMGCIIFIPLIPIDYILNESKLLVAQLLMFGLCMSTLFFTYKKWFNFAKVYFFIVVVAFIWVLGIGIGPGSGNHLILFAVFIAPAMLFKDLRIIIVLCLITMASLVGLPFAQKEVTPFIDVPLETRKNFLIVFQVIVTTIIFFQVYYFKSINFRFQDLLSSKNDEIAEKNKEIVDSINYAKRIQDAYLPPKSVLSSTFKDSFLLFQPKDIVSGDFYWFYTPKIDGAHTDISFVIAADCTGHGVPGAIMSVICTNAINEVIVKEKEYNTGKILDKVRERIIAILKTEKGDYRKDGMDVSMVKINRINRSVQFSGANNPLWVLRKDALEMEVIKGDKQPVGAFENATAFNAQDMQLNEGDILYLFSDGYQDQFGGEKGKKFKAANMKTMLIDVKDKSMSDQHEIVYQEFHQWKADLEQVDDVVMIGIRL